MSFSFIKKTSIALGLIGGFVLLFPPRQNAPDPLSKLWPSIQSSDTEYAVPIPGREGLYVCFSFVASLDALEAQRLLAQLQVEHEWKRGIPNCMHARTRLDSPDESESIQISEGDANIQCIYTRRIGFIEGLLYRYRHRFDEP